ncbi:MAG: serine/threonine protein kinase [Planctomyces sp.]|nr:serine/threonine protein kinase [Planctomyces sp.]
MAKSSAAANRETSDSTRALTVPISAGTADVSRKAAAGSALTATDLLRQQASGKLFQQYRIGELLGQGGMGTVYSAAHLTLGKQFAIKFLAPGLIQSAEAASRFRDEVTSLGQLQHPNLVNAVDAGVFDGLYYLVTELIQGMDLQRRIALDGPMSEEQVLRLADQAAAGLANAHSNGFVHRDIKPSNLMLDEYGTLRILDFGIARHARHSHGHTASGQLLGTVDYLSPEQAADAQSVDHRSDLYSLGCALVFLLTGQPPFPDEDFGSFAAKIKAHLFETPRLLIQPLSQKTRILLASLLAKKPDDRPKDAEHARSMIQEALSGLQGRQAGPCSRHPVPVRRRFNRWLSAVICVSGVVCVGAVTISRFNPDSNQHVEVAGFTRATGLEPGTAANIEAGAEQSPEEDADASAVVVVEEETPSEDSALDADEARSKVSPGAQNAGRSPSSRIGKSLGRNIAKKIGQASGVNP